jgi:mannose-1-phosphate guanylyltransferase
MSNEKYYAVVMAGGKGERFWPQSRVSHPKQLLRLIGNLTLIEQTVERLVPLIKLENIIVITNQEYVAPMRSLLSQLPKENIIGEPVGRDTAPCIGLAAGVVKARGGDDAVMIMLPSDHAIQDSTGMQKVLQKSAEVAQTGSIVTIGVNPSFASTGYGYIHCGAVTEEKDGVKFFRSLGFKEKPDTKTAEKLVAEGCYKWNSGMFIWTVDTIMTALQQFIPCLNTTAIKLCEAEKNGTLEQSLLELYPACQKISIDYAIMEKVSNVIVAECIFDWDDVGSWTALRNQIKPNENNNVIRGLYEGIDSENNIIVGESKHLIATIDVDNLIVVHTDDATLICNAKSAQRIKELVQKISSKPELKKYL